MAFATEHPVIAHSEYRAVDDVVRTGGKFEVVSEYQPAGDQPAAINDLERRIRGGERDVVLLGATGLHAVYLGRWRRGLLMLATAVVGGVLTLGLATVAMGLWGFTEGLLVLCARRGRFAHDAWGRPLRG